jgi:hypothetical protein
MKCNETLSKWYKNKHGASKIIDTFETYQGGAAGSRWQISRDSRPGGAGGQRCCRQLRGILPRCEPPRRDLFDFELVGMERRLQVLYIGIFWR